MKQFHEEIMSMYFGGMSIRDIALDAEITTEDVKDIIDFMLSLEN
jgi:uncharacterized protein (DUF433 family)